METKEIIALVFIVGFFAFNLWLAFHNPWKKKPTKAGQFSNPDKYLRDCKDIPENKDLLKYPAIYEECYVMEDPKISQFTVDKMREAHLKQLEWYKILMEQIELSGEVSEQSVILNKMDEIANTFPHPRIKGDLIWNPERTAVTFIRSPEGRYILGCDPVTPKSFDGSKRKYFEHDEQAFIPHPYPSDLI